MIFGLNFPKLGLHFKWNKSFKKNIISLFSGFIVPKKLVPISFCIFLTKWLEIFVLALEQSLWRSYVYLVCLVDLLACLTKDQQSLFDICAKITPKLWF